MNLYHRSGCAARFCCWTSPEIRIYILFARSKRFLHFFIHLFVDSFIYFVFYLSFLRNILGSTIKFILKTAEYSTMKNAWPSLRAWSVVCMAHKRHGLLLFIYFYWLQVNAWNVECLNGEWVKTWVCVCYVRYDAIFRGWWPSCRDARVSFGILNIDREAYICVCLLFTLLCCCEVHTSLVV